jgi:hypothetical protein
LKVDGDALRLFSNDELRDHFKLSLGVLKKHAELSGQGLRQSANTSNNDKEIEEAERKRKVVRSCFFFFLRIVWLKRLVAGS